LLGRPATKRRRSQSTSSQGEQGCQGEQDVSQGDESSSINDVNIDDLNVDCSFLTVKNKLKLLCLNCCGLNLRLNYTAFGELICQHDCICLQETKTDDTYQINFPEYILKNKKQTKVFTLDIRKS
jgi:hypothetical protein